MFNDDQPEFEEPAGDPVKDGGEDGGDEDATGVVTACHTSRAMDVHASDTGFDGVALLDGGCPGL